MEKKNVWETYSSKQLKDLEKLNQEYRTFLDKGKTERECIDYIVNTVEAEGYRELDSVIKQGASLQPGDKVYSVWMNKSIVMFQIGEKPMTEGMNILGAHIDSPRMDVKQNPLYEDGGFAYLDTHYYGGVKKYQWVTLPLALHGVVVKKDGTTIEINVGENEDDPDEIVSDYSTVSLTLSSPTYGMDEIRLYSKPQSVKNDNYNYQNWIGSNCLVYSRDLYCKNKTYTARIKIYIRLKDQLFEVNNRYLLDSNAKYIAITLYNNKTGEEIVFDEVSDGYIYITEYETHNLGKASGNFEIRYADNTTITDGSFQDIQVNKGKYHP